MKSIKKISLAVWR